MMSAAQVALDARSRKRISLLFAILAYATGWAILSLQHGQVIAEQPGWPLILDCTLTVPLVYLWLNRHAGRAAVIGAIALCATGILFASWLLPNEPVIGGLGWLRNVLTLLLIVAECALIFAILRVLPQLRQSDNPEAALLQRIDASIVAGPVAQVLRWETRMWLHLFAPSRWQWKFPGEQHFSYHRKDANSSDQLGFVVLMLLSLPVDHLVLMLFSPVLALIVTALTAYATCCCVAHYRAVHRRPISIDSRFLHLRNGVMGDLSIAIEDIATATQHRDEVARRSSGVMRFGAGNRPNVCLRLRRSKAYPGPLGMPAVADTVYFSVDNAASIIVAIRERLAATDVEARVAAT